MTMPRTARVGVGRPEGKLNRCESCGIRMTIGEPRLTDAWASHIREHRLSDWQIELLLMAAAEFAALSRKAGEPESVVAFIDWLTPEATGRFTLVHPEFDGRSRNHDGSRVSEPFPLPRGMR